MRCNHEMVELERLEGEEDIVWLKQTLEDFVEKTGSQRAQHILQSWDDEVKHFWKVSALYRTSSSLVHLLQYLEI